MTARHVRELLIELYPNMTQTEASLFDGARHNLEEALADLQAMPASVDRHALGLAVSRAQEALHWLTEAGRRLSAAKP